MAENSKIEWTDHTFNPWIGCTKVSDGCKHCYAETLMDKRMGKVKWGPEGTRVRTSAANWRKPLAWNKQRWVECIACGWRGSDDADIAGCPGCGQSEILLFATRQRVFCASLADVFEDRPELVEWRRDLLVVIERTPNLDWLLLTKRPQNINRMISDALGGDDPAVAVWFARNRHVWIGTSVENQQTADERIPELLRVPAQMRFLSIEPLLGEVDLSAFAFVRYVHRAGLSLGDDSSIHWVIVGGESGHNARPMHSDWARSLRDQCVAAGVAFHFKQWGNWSPMLHADSTGKMHFWPNGGASQDVGKHAAGRLLDGRTWDEFPKENQ